MIKKIIRTTVLVSMMLAMFFAGALVGNMTGRLKDTAGGVKLAPEIEESIAKNQMVFSDLGSFRVLIVRGRFAKALLYKFQREMIMYPDLHLLIFLDLASINA